MQENIKKYNVLEEAVRQCTSANEMRRKQLEPLQSWVFLYWNEFVVTHNVPPTSENQILNRYILIFKRCLTKTYDAVAVYLGEKCEMGMVEFYGIDIMKNKIQVECD